MNFGQALEQAKKGNLVQRESWGCSQFIFIRPDDVIQKEFTDNIKSLPEKFKDYLNYSFNGMTQWLTEDPIEIYFTEYICMYIGTKERVINGWIPSQEDLLSEDWKLIDEFEKK